MKNKYLILYLLGMVFPSLLFQSCKKDPKLRAEEPIPTSGTRTELTLDSIFLYAREVYLWNYQLPTYNIFNPRKYSSVGGSELDKLETELFNITQTPINPATSQPYEYTGGSYPKYSYLIEDNTNKGIVSAVSLEGRGDDFGFALTAVAGDDIRIRYVNPGSPAAIAGLVRGYRLTKMNNITVGSTTSNAFFDDAFSRSSMSLTVQKPDGSIQNLNLSRSFYTSSPVFKKAVITSGSKKIGYIAYARFSNLNNSQADLNQAFSEFASAGIADLVIDLRYNGGGYVNTAEYMTNLIAPSSLNDKVMYIEHYNDLMRSGKATILSKQILRDENGNPVMLPSGSRVATYADIDFSEAGNTYKFSKQGGLETIQNVHFIVSANTASASELVINNLRPHVNVKIIGSTTYGKPVGFFPIEIHKYDVYMSNFSSRNASNQGDYYSGMTPDISAIDDVTRDFGDPEEISLSKAIAYITTGALGIANTTMVLKGNRVMSASAVKVQHVGADVDFKGMIETRLKLKK